MKRYRRIVIGATFYGCGVAAREPETLILESSSLPGTDFTTVFLPGREWSHPLKHPAANRFRQMLVKNGILQREKLQTGGLVPIFSQWCLEQKLQIEFLSNIIRKENNRITVQSPAGITEFFSEEILDAELQNPKKYLTALLSHPAKMFETLIYPEYRIVSGPFPDESCLMMEFPREKTWTMSRIAFFNAWNRRPPELREWTLVLIGTRFAFDIFPNPAVALDCGLSGGSYEL